MLSASRRAIAANASDSCGATRAGSGGSTRSLPPCDPQALDLVEDGPGDLRLGGLRDLPLGSIGGQNRHLVLIHIESDSGVRYVIDDDCVQTLPLELAARVVDRPGAVLGGEPDEDLTGRAPPGQIAEDVGRGLELECPRRRRVVLLQLLLGAAGGP